MRGVSLVLLAASAALVAATARRGSWLSQPLPRSRADVAHTVDVRGPCDAPYYASTAPAQVVTAGSTLSLSWPRNARSGGMVRLAWAPSDFSSAEASAAVFDLNVQSYSCFEAGCTATNGCNEGDLTGTCTPCQHSVRVPAFVSGSYTLQWVWYGGGEGVPPQYSCSDFVVRNTGATGGAAVTPSFTGGDASSTTSCSVCPDCDKAYPAGTGPLLSALEAGDVTPRARTGDAAAPGLPGDTGDTASCVGCWWGTSGRCQAANTLCYDVLTTGECPVGTVRCSTQTADGAAHPPAALPTPAPGASNNMPSPSPSPITRALTPPSVVGGVACQRCELSTAGACQAPNGVCYPAVTEGVCPEGTLLCAQDSTADFLDNAGAALSAPASGRRAGTGEAGAAGAQCNACVDTSAGPCMAPLGQGATQHLCLPFRAGTTRCPLGSIPCIGSALSVGGGAYATGTGPSPTPSPRPSPAALPRTMSVLATRGGHPYVQLGYVHAQGTASARRSSRWQWGPDSTNATLFTHLVWAYARPILAPSVGTDPVYGVSTYGAEEVLEGGEGNPADGAIAKWHAAVRTANPAVRTLLGMGGFDAGAGFFSTALATPATRAAFATRLLGFARAKGFDGVQLDITYPGLEALGGNPGGDREALTAFVQELRRLVDGEARGAGQDRLILSVGVGPSPAIADVAYDIPALTAAADHLVLHAWDVRGPWEDTTGSATPLHDVGRQGLGLVDFVNHWLGEGADRGKLVLGVSAYARTWTLGPGAAALVSGTNPRVPAVGPGPAGQDSGVPGYLTTWEVADMVRGGARVHWDGAARTWIATDGSVYASFENEVSLRAKVDFIREARIGGYALWGVHSDDWLHGSPLAAALATRITAPASNLFYLDVALPANSGVGTAGLSPLRALRAWAHGWLSLDPPADPDVVEEETRCLEPVAVAGAVASELSIPPTAVAISDVTGWRSGGSGNDGLACPKVYTLGLRFVGDAGLPLTSFAAGALPPDAARISASIDATGVWVPASPPGDGLPDAAPTPAPPLRGGGKNGTDPAPGLPSLSGGGLGSGGLLPASAPSLRVDSRSGGVLEGVPSSAFFTAQPSWLAPFWYTSLAAAGDVEGTAGAWRRLVAPQSGTDGVFLGNGSFFLNGVREVEDNVLTDSTPPSASSAPPSAPAPAGLSGGAVAAIVIITLLVLGAVVAAFLFRRRIAATCAAPARPARRRTLSGTARPGSVPQPKWPPVNVTRPTSVLHPPAPTTSKGGSTRSVPTRSRSISGADGSPRPVAVPSTEAPSRPPPRRAGPRRVVAPPQDGATALPARA